MKYLFLAISCLSMLSSFAQQSPIIPQPAELKMGQGTFAVGKKTIIVTKGGGLEKSASFLQAYIKKMYGLSLPIS